MSPIVPACMGLIKGKTDSKRHVTRFIVQVDDSLVLDSNNILYCERMILNFRFNSSNLLGFAA